MRGVDDKLRSLGEAARRHGVSDNTLRIDIRGPKLNLELSGRATGWGTRQQISVVLDRSTASRPTSRGGSASTSAAASSVSLDGQEPARIGISFLSNGANLAGAAPAPPVVVPPATALQVTEEHGTDRRGRDYTDFRARDLAECTSACLNDSRCKAYSCSRNDSHVLPEERCSGRQQQPRPVSGVKETSSAGGSGSGAFDVRDGFDQPGSDFATFATRESSACLARCDQNSRCLAFTYNRAAASAT